MGVTANERDRQDSNAPSSSGCAVSHWVSNSAISSSSAGGVQLMTTERDAKSGRVSNEVRPVMMPDRLNSLVNSSPSVWSLRWVNPPPVDRVQRLSDWSADNVLRLSSVMTHRPATCAARSRSSGTLRGALPLVGSTSDFNRFMMVVLPDASGPARNASNLSPSGSLSALSAHAIAKGNDSGSIFRCCVSSRRSPPGRGTGRDLRVWGRMKRTGHVSVTRHPRDEISTTRPSCRAKSR